ncbi:hypothetical protein HY450_03995 [Candidatus Pacearchaeota archaeon]|nr:hypothetical protein [Candidatus Pacearchaeota archaeon]
MAERVSTGGVMTFDYGKGYSPELEEDKKKEIRDAYEEYYERKRKEKKKKRLILILVILILVVIGLFIYKFT